MQVLTARPERIVGNIALASLLAGMPLGVLLSVFGVLAGSSGMTTMEVLKDVGSGALLCPAILFIVSVTVVAPIVAGLRHIGYAGPFSVYSISVVFGVIAMADDVRFGTIAMIVGLAASFVFCRYAYRETATLAGVD